MDTVLALLRPFAGCAAMVVLCVWMMRGGHTANPSAPPEPPVPPSGSASPSRVDDGP